MVQENDETAILMEKGLNSFVDEHFVLGYVKKDSPDELRNWLMNKANTYLSRKE